jgi:hypothetical protein
MTFSLPAVACSDRQHFGHQLPGYYRLRGSGCCMGSSVRPLRRAASAVLVAMVFTRSMIIFSSAATKGADSAQHRYGFGNNVGAVTAVNSANGYHRRVVGYMQVAAYNGLQAADDLRRGYNRVDTLDHG